MRRAVGPRPISNEMSEMRFENQGEEFGRPPTESGVDFTGKLVKWGLVSSRQEAQYVLVGIAVLAIILAVLAQWYI